MPVSCPAPAFLVSAAAAPPHHFCAQPPRFPALCRLRAGLSAADDATHSARPPAGQPSADHLHASQSSPASAGPCRSAAVPSHRPHLRRAPLPAHSAGSLPATSLSSAPHADALPPARPAPCVAAPLLLRSSTTQHAPAPFPTPSRQHPAHFSDRRPPCLP